ncbi:MAG: ribosome small subunit-dependent GTPase A [Candidatus Weimeria sp.]|nr:ribosome small subunit-dependent GTPase A [Candidatus Weimeria sp.]
MKALSGFYYVLPEGEDTVYACRAKGVFRKKNQHPLVGDLVTFDVTHEKDMEGHITAIEERSSSLIRPPVANCDQALVIFAVHTPDLNHNQLTRYLVMLEQKGISPIIVFSKKDLNEEGDEEELRKIYGPCGYPICFVSSREKSGIEEVRELLKGHVTTVAGPSGAGKSALINALSGREVAATGSVSERTGRGKQTTRHTELLCIAKDTYLFDTPGFSSIENSQMEKEELSGYFPEIRAFAGDCRFRGCAHDKEPGCAVKEAVISGEISEQRYQDYLLIYHELRDQKKY